MRVEAQIGVVAAGLGAVAIAAGAYASYQGGVAGAWLFGGAVCLLLVVAGGPVRPWRTTAEAEPPSPGPVASFLTKVNGGKKGVTFFQRLVAEAVVEASGGRRTGPDAFFDPRDDGTALKGEEYLQALRGALGGARDD